MNSVLKKIVGSEDSLMLNIFSKDVKPKKLYPVMVYIYGGAFSSGSNTTKAYAPDYLLMADVVLVTLNYRTGALGFMFMKDKELNVPGNAGLKDQLMAMKFVKSNIEKFGGDPNNITLFGHSAGGASVSWHCASDKSKGLFHRAIIMSGCVHNVWSSTTHRDWANRVARRIGYEGSEDEKDILEFLQQADPVQIVENQKGLVTLKDETAFAFAPIIEPYSSNETLIPTNGLEMLRTAWTNDIDVLIGGTADEGLMYLEDIRANPAALSRFTIDQVLLQARIDPKHPKSADFVEALKRIYYPASLEPSNDEMAYCKVRCHPTHYSSASQ